MKKIFWDARLPGDIFLYHGAGLLSSMIRAAELAMHPSAPEDFVPSHAGIIGGNDTVVEALLSITPTDNVDSVAAVSPADKYRNDALLGRIELWRPNALCDLAEDIAAYTLKYESIPYGGLNLLGFEWVAICEGLFHESVVNPIKEHLVCSQGAIICLGAFIGPLSMEQWAVDFVKVPNNIADCNPLQLRLLFLEHQTP